jgi:hypothetical protein
MKPHVLLSLMLLLGFATGMASASPVDDKATENRTIPVLVNVNAKGDVTDIAPAYKLRPSFTRQLRDALRKMITKPAMKDGKAVSSQLVITLALVPVAQGNGKHGVNIKYVSGQALPPGTWHWVHTSGHRLALAGQNQQFAMPIGDRAAKQREINEMMGLHATDPLQR